MDTKSSGTIEKGLSGIGGRQHCGKEVKLQHDMAVVPPQDNQQTVVSHHLEEQRNVLIINEARSGACLEAAVASLSAGTSASWPNLIKSNEGDGWPPAAPPSTPVDQTLAETEADVADELTLATSTGTITQRDNLPMPKPMRQQESDTDEEPLVDNKKRKYNGSCPYLNMLRMRAKAQKKSSAQPVCSCKEQCPDGHSIMDLFYPERMHPALESLLYWRQPRRTLAILIYVLLFIMGTTQFSVINVAAYMTLAVLLFSMSWRLVQCVEYGLCLQPQPNPLDYVLDVDWHLSLKLVRQLALGTVASVRKLLKEFKRACLCPDFWSSMRLAVILWLVTYIGNWFNGLTLIFCTVLLAFSLPKLCEHCRHLQRERSCVDVQNGVCQRELLQQLTEDPEGEDCAAYGYGSCAHAGGEALDADPLIVDDDDKPQFLGAGDY